MTTRIGTPNTRTRTKVLMLGSGELGKEVVIELMRLGVEVVACDRYASAPAMQVAHRSHVLSMQDADKLRAVITEEKPDYVVPEIEAIATDTLVELEKEGVHVIPTARAARLTMDREGIRRLAAEDLGLKTSPYRFAVSEEEYRAAVEEVGLPCVVKPIMSSSGKGQSTVKTADDIEEGWRIAQEGARGGAGPGSSSRASSTSITRSPCSPFATRPAPASAHRSGIARSTATTTSPGSRSP